MLSHVSVVRFMPCRSSVDSVDSGLSHQTLYHCVIIREINGRREPSQPHVVYQLSGSSDQVPSPGIARVSSFHSKTVFKYDSQPSGHIYQRDGSPEVRVLK